MRQPLRRADPNRIEQGKEVAMYTGDQHSGGQSSYLLLNDTADAMSITRGVRI